MDSMDAFAATALRKFVLIVVVELLLKQVVLK